MPCVVADTSPLFYLARLEKLSLLHDLYESIAVPERVWHEALAGGQRFPGILPLLQDGATRRWIEIHPTPDLPQPPEIERLDAGERDAILLAQTLNAECLLIDDLRGRESAQALGLKVKGTLAILADAKTAGLIPSLAQTYRALLAETTFRFSRKLEELLLREAGELPVSGDSDIENA